MQTKKISLFLLVVLCLIGVMWLSISKVIFKPVVVTPSIESSNTGLNSSISLEQKTAILESSKQIILKQFDNWKSTWTPAEADEQTNWLRNHGDFSASGGNDYDNYDMSTLQKLAESNDIQAMHALATLYLSEKYGLEYGFKYAEPLYWKAAILGSTTALTELASIHDSKYRYGKYTPEEKRTAILEALAIHKVAALRGDRFGLITIGRIMLDNNGMRDISIAEEKFVDARTHEIYLDLQTKRSDLGLGPFDNSVPDSVKRYFEKLEHK